MNSWIVDVKENETGEPFIDLPPEILDAAGLKEGDTIEWVDNKDGSWTMQKAKTQLVLVECISQFRHRYVVEVPVGTDDYGNDKATWALDTVVAEKAKEFSQQHLGETIVSHRVISHEDVLKLCDEDNDYATGWNTDKKLKAFVTSWVDQEQHFGVLE